MVILIEFVRDLTDSVPGLFDGPSELLDGFLRMKWIEIKLKKKWDQCCRLITTAPPHPDRPPPYAEVTHGLRLCGSSANRKRSYRKQGPPRRLKDGDPLSLGCWYCWMRWKRCQQQQQQYKRCIDFLFFSTSLSFFLPYFLECFYSFLLSAIHLGLSIHWLGFFSVFFIPSYFLLAAQLILFRFFFRFLFNCFGWNFSEIPSRSLPSFQPFFRSY